MTLSVVAEDDEYQHHNTNMDDERNPLFTEKYFTTTEQLIKICQTKTDKVGRRLVAFNGL